MDTTADTKAIPDRDSVHTCTTTVVAARFLWQSKPASRRFLRMRVTHRISVPAHYTGEQFRGATKSYPV